MDTSSFCSDSLLLWIVSIVCVFLLWNLLTSLFTRRISTDKKAIFVTGCDSGFGLQLALHAAEAGFRVFAGCLGSETDGARKCRNHGNVDVIKIDVSKQADVDAALDGVKEVLRKEGLSLHGVVNNAGVVLTTAPVEWVNPETIAQTLDINTLGGVRVTRTFLPLIRAAKGRIVNVGSMASHVAAPNMIPYAMSKGASFMFTNGLRREMKQFGVKVSSISPTFYTTNITTQDNKERSMLRAWNEASPTVQADYGGQSVIDKMVARSKLPIKGMRTNTIEVIDCIMDALTNVNPKADYICDLKSRILGGILEMIPLKWVDSIVNKDYI